jgi:hypothetical protein
LRRNRTRNPKVVWRSAAASRLLELANGSKTVEEAIEQLAGRHLDGVKCPPTHLESVGSKLRINAFEAADIPGSGELRRDGNGFRIFYSTFLSVERQRFTIAHELAHALLEQTGSRVPRQGKELERLCDMFAVELLMPKSVFLEMTRGEISTQRIIDTAQQFRTSVAATGLRYAELRRVTVFACEELRVIWGRGSFRSLAGGSVYESFRPAVLKALNGEASTDEFFLNSFGSFQTWRIDCRPFARGKSVLCVLQPSGSRN